THGIPNDINAHTHRSNSGKIALVHNGIIENYDGLKKELQHKGYHFQSDTDTEVFVNLIEEFYSDPLVDLEQAVLLASQTVVGAFAIAVISEEEPDTLIISKNGSPLVVGLGEKEFFVASDPASILEHTKEVIYLDDQELVVFRGGTFLIKSFQNKVKTPLIQELEMDLESIEKGGFEHFMLKEIHEQPDAVFNAFRGRLNASSGTLVLGGLVDHFHLLTQAKRLILTACGTSWHACLVAEYLLEHFARIPVEVEYASEFRYRNPILKEGDVLLAVSQSGETADTLAAVKLAKNQNIPVLGICNVVGSTLSRLTDAGSYTHAGPEIGVASTKAFTTQISVLLLVAIKLGLEKGLLERSGYLELLKEMERLPELLTGLLNSEEAAKKIATEFKDAKNFLYLGRGINFPVALEGALKLKEISYIHAEGYPAAEMKHGPIALIDKEMPVVFIALQDSGYEKIVSNIQEVKARGGRIISLVTEGDEQVSKLSDYVIEVPTCSESLSPILTVIPLQFLAYYIAVAKGCNVDQPRNLAKSVTVE
uniref:glutamine--fructose-6-phosphate transaminase (isomerizing) n=1 Tax=uncultured Algoriphagus sp. TaxID=417365 RepID=UPI0025971AA6